MEQLAPLGVARFRPPASEVPMYELWLPSRVRIKLEKAAVGWRSLRQTLGREERPVVELRTPPPRPAQASSARWYELPLVERVEQTDDAVTLVFANEGGLRFTPGQFVTLALDVDGEEVRRPYSLCGDPAHPERLSVTVKRMPHGKASSYLKERLKVGEVLRVYGPAGRFGTEPRPGASRHVVLVGGGSGVTPLLSIARALLAREPQTRVDFISANRAWPHVIFQRELAELAARHPALRLVHVLEEAHEGFDGPVGRLDPARALELLPRSPQAEYYICGPAPMMDAVCDALKAQGVEEARLHTERFTPAAPLAPVQGLSKATYAVKLARQNLTLLVAEGETILSAAMRAGIDLPFSCAVGGCGACRQTVLQGEVEMDEPHCLTQEERKRGACLTCVACPKTPVTLDV